MRTSEVVAFLEWLRRQYVLTRVEDRPPYGRQLVVEAITNEALAAAYVARRTAATRTLGKHPLIS